MIDICAVGYESCALEEKAQLLATRLGFSLEKEASSCLYLASDKLSLKIGNFSLLSADFSAATWAKRKAAGKKQGLVRACKPVSGMKIIDATGGWGRDAAILASFGAEVLLIERNPIIAALLADALERLSEQDKRIMKLSLQNTDARSYLTALSDAQMPDVIYIDPMHPVRNKAALVKKDMQALQQIIGADEDALELLRIAIPKAKQHVVVKWPQKTKPLLTPTSSIEGKTIRFDRYAL